MKKTSRLREYGIDSHHQYGIPKTSIPRVTERFFRVDPEHSKKIGGTGLGLAIVKHLINQHRGEFHIESEIGKGSEFFVKLPLHN